MRQDVVIVDGSVVGDAFDDVDGLLIAPTDRPCSTATRGHEDRFAHRSALFILHGYGLAPVSGGVNVLARRGIVASIGIACAAGGRGCPSTDGDTPARTALVNSCNQAYCRRNCTVLT